MGWKEDSKNIGDRLDRLHSWTEKQEAAIGQLEVATGKLERSVEGIERALRDQVKALINLQREFSLQVLKVILWSVGIVFSLFGLVFAVWKAATSN